VKAVASTLAEVCSGLVAVGFHSWLLGEATGSHEGVEEKRRNRNLRAVASAVVTADHQDDIRAVELLVEGEGEGAC
jgi:hypothetical protein